MEFWLVDVRGESIIFQINRHGESGYEGVEFDANGLQRSEVFGCSFGLAQRRNEDGFWEYELRVKGETLA